MKISRKAQVAGVIKEKPFIKEKPSGKKYDRKKLNYALLPWDAVEEVVKVLDYGAKKYAPDNWKHVDNAEDRYFAAAMRHLLARRKGFRRDSQSRKLHLAHATCCLLFLLAKDLPPTHRAAAPNAPIHA